MKTFITGVLFILILVGCSEVKSTINNEDGGYITATLNEKVEELEKELDAQSKALVETEKELNQLKKLKNDVSSDGEYIKIPIKAAPRLHENHDVQLWEIVTDFSLSYENGWERGLTDWRRWEGEIPDTFASTSEQWETPGQLLSNWMNANEFSHWNGIEVFEVTMRVDYDFANEKATGYILTYGYKDDAIAGSVVKVIMKNEGDSWFIEEVYQRDQCHRNADGELCV